MRLERYRGVRGRRNVDFISYAIEEAGGQILSGPDPSVAPYDYLIRLPSGERRDLVCYAFTAKRYRPHQGERPEDEHRFQIKYGSDFKRYHDLFIDQKGARTTLLFGVHEEYGLFICVDPRLHTPTWFSCSVEFKDHDLLRARSKGWHGWERERSPGRRKKPSPLESFRTEALCAFTPKHFLNYIELERHASGLDATERLIVAEGFAKAGVPMRGKRHPLEQMLGLSSTQLLDVLSEGNPRVLTAVRGRVAEYHLGVHLRGLPGVSAVRVLDQDGPPDYSLTYRRKPFRIECKNVGGRLVRPKVDFQKTRAAKGNPCSRYYAASQFEVLAACMYAVTKRWDYRFCATSALSPHKRCSGKLSEHVYVEGDAWMVSLSDILDSFF